MLSVGARAPDFEGVDQHGRPVTLGELRGRWVVLYFYPKDDTRGCTIEACRFRDNLEEFRSLGAVVLGVSVQDANSHRAFAERHDIPFQLVADSSHRITRAYHALGLMGLARRVTYLIDPEGRIVDAFRSELRPEQHIARMMHLLRERAPTQRTTGSTE